MLNELERAVTQTMLRYFSEILAQSARRRAQTALGIPDGRLRRADVPRLVRQLEPGIRLFVDRPRQAALLRELAELGGDAPTFAGESHELRSESDVSAVRLRVREIAQLLGGSAMGAQRAATAASELARNVVAYAGGGSIALEPAEPDPSLRVIAIDRGPGIADLELVLSGEYRSRTGLGKGLLGVKRLASRFDVATGPSGTRVEVELAL